MAEVAKKHQDRLSEIKCNVEEAHDYFVNNVQRYKQFKDFVFKTSMTEDEVAVLQDLGKPTIEFNILEAYVSRLRGEFAKQQPSLKVRAADGIPDTSLTPNFTLQIEVIEAHLRAIFFDGDNDMLQYNVYTDLLSGGFSVMRVDTEFVNEKSFEQNIYVDRVFDPTLTFFDPLARDSHKGDGEFCGEFYPMTRERFEDEYGSERASRMSYTKNISGFGWSYKSAKDDIILVCDYFEKKTKRAKICKLSNGHVVTKKEYDEFIEQWNEQSYIEQPPIIIKERWTQLEYICRYTICENEVLDYEETNFRYLPLVFVDGNSTILYDGDSTYQFTRPYVYHAMGIQRLKNFAGQSLANELENTIQNKWVVAKEAIPDDYLDAYKDPQKADVLVYNHYYDKKNPDQVLPAPREVSRTPIPPQISETFRMSDEMTQAILGSYDNAQGMQNAQLSGIAFARSAMQSNNASVPYIVGYIKGINRAAQIIVDLIPKYYRTPRSLPIMLPSGKREYMQINKRGSLFMNYDPNSMDVKVDVGINFAMQKEIALQTLTTLMSSSQLFSQFMNTHGLGALLDNIDIRGIEDLKLKAEKFEKEQQQNQQMQQQAGAQQMQLQQQSAQIDMQTKQANLASMMKDLQAPSRGQIEEAKVQLDAAKMQSDEAIKEKEAETNFLKVIGDVRQQDVDNELKQAQIDAEQSRTAVEMAINVSKHEQEIMKVAEGRNENATEEG